MSVATEPAPFYTRLQRRLHWLVIIMLILQFSLQNPMSGAMAAVERGEALGFVAFIVTTIHTWCGISIAAIMLWRWRLRRRHVPVAAGQLSTLRSKFVQLHHSGLYVVVVLMALSGAIHYYFEIEVAAVWHEWGKWLLIGLIGVHIAGALTHIRKGSRVFQRMMGPRSLSQNSDRSEDVRF
ncbi:cytochrome b/b6 domain-containing protein [Granulosicoccus sp.]|nr:cytochrome b/b6 domain-containing protein [Granulosicoccus sp.]MDB4223320.1 cytochrome b/b6 domain-containing protein [Granulosicoccus sp.]